MLTIMLIKHIFLFLGIFGCLYDLSAQTSVSLHGYSPDDVASSLVNEMTPVSGSKILFTKRVIGVNYEALVTDQNGQELHRTVLALPEGEILSSSFCFDDGDRYVFIGNALIDGQYYFASFAYDTILQQSTLIDTILLGDGELLFFNMMKLNKIKAVWEGFGITQTVPSNSLINNCFIQLDTQYHFLQHKVLSGTYQPDHILEFLWEPTVERYVVSSFNRRLMVVDEDINVHFYKVFFHDFIHLDTSYHSTIKHLNCEPVGDGSVLCYGVIPDQHPWSNVITKLDILPDSIILQNVIPLNESMLQISYADQMRIDSTGDFIISGVNKLFGNNPNKIRVARFSSDFELQGIFTYEDGDKSFVIWDMDIDANNNIIIGGSAGNIFGDEANRGFLMKLSADMVTSEETALDNLSDDIVIFPNPATDIIYVSHLMQPLKQVALFDLYGRLLLNMDIGGQDDYTRIILPGALPGAVYVVQCYMKNGNVVSKKIITGN